MKCNCLLLTIAMTICSFVPAQQSERRHDKLIEDRGATLERQRKQRVEAAILVLQKSPAVIMVRTAADVTQAIEVDAAIWQIGEDRAEEGVPHLLERLDYQPRSRISGIGDDFFNGFPAARSLAQIGAPAIPGLLELAKTHDNKIAGTIDHGLRAGVVKTPTLILRTLYAAAGDHAVIEDELKAEIARLEAAQPPTVEIRHQIQNLRQVLAESRSVRDEVALIMRRLLDEEKRRYDEHGK